MSASFRSDQLAGQGRPVRIGIVGGGVMGAKHAEVIAHATGAELTAVADPVVRKLADSAGVAYFADHRELFASGLADAVVIANPSAMHPETAIDAVAAGIPSLVEKPVAVTAAQAVELARAVAQSDVPVLVGHQRRHHPAVAVLHDALATGLIGDVVAVSGLWAARKHDSYFDLRWHREPGAGVVLINLIHELDLMRHLFGEVLSVAATTSTAARRLLVEDTACVIMGFESGALGSFVCTDSGVSPWGWELATHDDPTFPVNSDATCYRIAGTRGAVSIPDLTVYKYAGAEPGDWTRPLGRNSLPVPPGNSYDRQLLHFLAVVRGEQQPMVTVDDAARTVALADAVRDAAAEGRTVHV